MKQEERLERACPYSETNKREVPTNYKQAMSLYIRPAMQIVFDQLAENLEGMDGEVRDPVMVDDLIGAFRGALRLWDFIDDIAFAGKEG
jgi:hypothetical protein